METKFQTSFIPKKPSTSTIGMGSVSSAPRKHVQSSIYMTIATLLFIVSIISAGGVYAYNIYLTKNLVTLKDQLSQRQKQFNINLIETLKSEQVKIDTARSLLDNHLALSQIFQIIGTMTAENVRFMSLDLTAPDAKNNFIKINLQGYGASLSAVAFQSDVLGQLDQYGLSNIIKNPILSNPSLGNSGTVSFGFTADVNPASLSYEKSISVNSVPSTPSSNSSTNNNQTNISSTSSSGTVSTQNNSNQNQGSSNPFNSP